MSNLKICMLAVMGVSVSLILRQWKSDLLPLFKVALVLLFGVSAMTAAAPLIVYVKGIAGAIGSSEYTTILFKALGIAILTHFCSEICRECGESAAASGVELTGRIEILLLCLPLINEILEAAQAFLSLGS